MTKLSELHVLAYWECNIFVLTECNILVASFLTVCLLFAVYYLIHEVCF